MERAEERQQQPEYNQPGQRWQRSRLLTVVDRVGIAWVLLALSLSLNVGLVVKMFTVRRQAAAANRVGAVRLEQVTLRQPDGTVDTLKFPSRVPVVFYVFSPQCYWCKQNTERVNALCQQEKQAKFRVVALSLEREGLERYLKESAFQCRVYSDIDVYSRTRLGLGAVPHTLVISDRGDVEYAWHGQLDASIEEVIKSTTLGR